MVITQHIGKTAPGRVFETMIRELSHLADVSVITYNYNPHKPDALKAVTKLTVLKEPVFINPRLNYHANRLMLACFGISYTDFVAKTTFREKVEDFDYILCVPATTPSRW